MDKQVNPKDIEFDGDKLVSSVEEAASKLKSLKDHNDIKLFDAYGGNSFKSGIACPKCGSELYYNNPNMVLTSYPPKRSVECKNCKHTDYVY
jgi:DNA-directed RNA polymerase subunit M/transcription elongation factor TFIIS